MLTKENITRLTHEELIEKLIAFSMHIAPMVHEIFTKRMPGLVCTPEELISIKEALLERLNGVMLPKEVYVLLEPNGKGTSKISGVVSDKEAAKEWEQKERGTYPSELQKNISIQAFELDKIPV